MEIYFQNLIVINGTETIAVGNNRWMIVKNRHIQNSHGLENLTSS